jgi:hypothetical protein
MTAYILDGAKEDSANDAAPLPDLGQPAQVQVPALLQALGLDQIHALGVAADLCGVEGLADVVNEGLLVHGGSWLR